MRLAPTNHLEERSLPIGDELAESPLVSKSRITQIVSVSRNTLRWSDMSYLVRKMPRLDHRVPSDAAFILQNRRDPVGWHHSFDFVTP